MLNICQTYPCKCLITSLKVNTYSVILFYESILLPIRDGRPHTHIYIWNCDYVMGSENIWICLQIRNIVVYYITEHQMVKLHAYISPT